MGDAVSSRRVLYAETAARHADLLLAEDPEDLDPELRLGAPAQRAASIEFPEHGLVPAHNYRRPHADHCSRA